MEFIVCKTIEDFKCLNNYINSGYTIYTKLQLPDCVVVYVYIPAIEKEQILIDYEVVNPYDKNKISQLLKDGYVKTGEFAKELRFSKFAEKK